jgi:hypothetical protein
VSGPAIEVKSVKTLEIIGLKVPAPNSGSPVLTFQGVTDALLRDCVVPGGSGVFLGLVGDGNEQIAFDRNRLAAGIKERAP